MTIQYPGKLDRKRPIYFAMDHTNSKDKTICNTVVNKLKQAGLNVQRQAIGPNELYDNMKYVYNKGYTNAIIFNLMNGVDPSNIREVAVNGNDNRGRTVRARGNDAVLGWFYDACDCTRTDGSCYSHVKGSETGAEMYNPKQYADTNKIYLINQSSNSHRNTERADYTGEKIAQAFIDLFEDENSTPSTTPTTDDNDDEPQTTPVNQTTTTTNKTLSTRTITRTYTTAFYEKVIRAKTDLNGAFKAIPELPYRGEYTVTMKFAGDKTHSSSTRTIKIYNYSKKSSIFKERLIQTKIVNKYTDGTSDTHTNGTTPDNKHIKRVITTETYKNGKLTKKETRTVIVDNIISEKEVTEDENTTTPTTTPVTNPTAPEPNTPDPIYVDNTERYSPFQRVIPTTNGVPNVNAMQHGGKKFVNVDTNRSYQLSYQQFKFVYEMDSQLMQTKNYTLSNYTAFESEDTDTWNVCERQYWNSVVESIHYYRVTHWGSSWPKTIILDFKNKRTKCDDIWTNWKNTDTGKTTLWFCADDQDGKKDCGPTSLSVCTQVLMHYHPEVNLANRSPDQLRQMFNSRGFSATNRCRDNNDHDISCITKALSELDAGRPCIWHISAHYIALTLRSKHNGKILVANSAGDNSGYTYGRKLITGWQPHTNLNGSATGAHTFVRLDWTLAEDWKQKISNFYQSMGGAWERPFADEGIRKGFN